MADPAESTDALDSSPKPKARDLNNVVRYTMWSVFKIDRSTVNSPSEQLANEVNTVLADLAESDDVKLRGWYDVAGFRADADVMLWTHAPSSDALQTLYNRVLQTALGASLTGVWSQMALHRPAEFNKSHVPAFLAEERARNYVSVYPFVRSFEWYLLPDQERRELLAEHGKMGRGYPDVRANTVPAFSLGDYEWILAFEADELDRIVDLMRHLRASRARLHVREEIPFYTGRRWELADYLAAIS
ncbi:MAG: chlorite dismutase family protein [Actinobacteria bacterium]|nr:chlorite dismutase family protein [Actinomycetota bacterium]